MASTLVTSNFNNVTGTSSKNIRYATLHQWVAYKEEYKSWMKQEKTDMLHDQYMGYEGFGAPPEMDEQEDFSVAEYKEGYKKTTTQKQFGYEVRMSWQQQQFALKSSGFTKQLGFFLGRGGGLRYDYTAAGVLNNGFTDSAAFHGGDGKPLYSASHPWKVGGTYSNLLTSAAFSKTVAKSVHNSITNAKMENNIPAKIKPNQVVFGYEIGFDLEEIYNSVKDPDSANHRKNYLADIVPNFTLNSFLSDTNSYHYQTEQSYLCLIEHTSPFLTTEVYPNKVVGENLFMSFVASFKAALGSWGSQGG